MSLKCNIDVNVGMKIGKQARKIAKITIISLKK
jgi:hypothetical protein